NGEGSGVRCMGLAFNSDFTPGRPGCAYMDVAMLVLAAAYLPNAKLLPPTHEGASGPAAIEKFFAGLHANGVTNHKLEVIDAGGDDKVVYGTANWSAKGKDKDGKPANFSGIATHVFERQADGSLKLRLHTFN